MTDEELIKLAREAGMSYTPPRPGQYDGGRIACDLRDLLRFVRLERREPLCFDNYDDRDDGR